MLDPICIIFLQCALICYVTLVLKNDAIKTNNVDYPSFCVMFTLIVHYFMYFLHCFFVILLVNTKMNSHCCFHLVESLLKDFQSSMNRFSDAIDYIGVVYVLYLIKLH